MRTLKVSLVAVVVGFVFAIAPEARAFQDQWNSGVGGKSSDPQSGDLLDSSPVLSSSSTCWTPRMAIDSAGIVFVTTSGCSPGSLVSLNADLTVRWSEPSPLAGLGGPVIGKNGTLVICGGGTDVRAYRGTSDGLPGPPLQVSRQGANLVITFSGRLQSVDRLPGLWTDVPRATSPWSVSTQEPQTFYRSIQE